MTDVVIVNWNSGHFLERCVASLFSGNNEQFVNRIIIVDNNSSDGSGLLINKHEKITLISNKENRGFAKACNQGFKLCDAAYVLLLNPDAALLNNTLQDAIQFLNNRKDVDILGCQLIDEKGMVTPSCSRFPTPIHILFDASGLSKIAPKFFTPATVMTDWDHQESRFAQQVMGAFMLMRINIFERLGYFDERFFVYFEEVDFCKRLSLINGKVFYNTAIKAIHTGEGTTSKVKAFRLFLSLQSRLKYARKHFSTPGFILVWLSTFLIEPFSRTLYLLIKQKPAEVPAVWKGIGMFMRKQQR